MKRRSFVLAAVLALVPLGALAQVPDATPTPDAHQYNDPAMHFSAPPDFYPVGQRNLSVDQLTDDLQMVAGWVSRPKNRNDRPLQLGIQMQSFDGSLDGFSSTFEEQLRGSFQSALFKDKQNISLRNGMPALFMQMSSGEGFASQTMYIVLWIDGQRGVAVSLLTGLGQMDADTAKSLLLSDTSAVRYPSNRS
jgi:hypothetical protein